ncbi:MAG: GtrA family protein [Pseudomonadota bacterium]
MHTLLSWTVALYTYCFRFLKFSLIGGLTAGIYFFCTMVLIEWLSLDYFISTAIAYLPATTFQFFVNKYYTFQQDNQRTLQAYRRYVALLMVNYVTTMCIIYLTVETAHLSPYLGMAAAVPATMLLGYVLSKNWVYKA